ncbi:MAG: FKBP-type peptidyl-prolyl cis-trans isomerase [Treponema sp.]|jgi:FKBP-type peptidyl-prolyl cis-trans isomerase FkpA|nr:FKBP-type peptidyl-prolyl cis-trans isomerase [Treponema sp.]
MKRCAIVSCLFFVALAVQANGIREDIDFTGEKARTSYAFGMTVGGDLKQAGLEMDYAAFMEGLRSAMEQGQTVMDRDEALEIVQNAFESTLRKQSAELQAKEEAFLAANASQADINITDSGLQYLVLEEGSGPKPTINDMVQVHYEGTLTDGTVFDSSYERDEPETFSLDMVISGWTEAILLMNVGSKYRVYIPSRLAYGERGAGQVIPPFSTLIFTVELLDITENIRDDDDEEADDSLSGESDSED